MILFVRLGGDRDGDVVHQASTIAADAAQSSRDTAVLCSERPHERAVPECDKRAA